MPIEIEHEGKTVKAFLQDEVDGYIAAERRAKDELTKVKTDAARVPQLEQELNAVKGERDTLACTKGELEGKLQSADKHAAAMKALIAAGVKPERLDKALKNLPDDADFGTDDAITKTVEAIKTDLPEWFGPADPAKVVPANNTVSKSPTETKPSDLDQSFTEAEKTGNVAASIALKNQKFGYTPKE
jgi:hypothetical protein